MKDHETKTKNQFAIVIVPKLPDHPRAFAFKTLPILDLVAFSSS
jgi:hypothetical protein